MVLAGFSLSCFTRKTKGIHLFERPNDSMFVLDLKRRSLVTATASASIHIGLTCLNGGTLLGATCLCTSRFAGKRCQIDADCTFDAGTVCNWADTHAGDTFDWIVYHEETPTDDTGPENDHSLGTANGSYAFIESSAPRIKDEKARLQSPVFNPPGPEGLCLHFWYNMNGETIGQLNVYKGNGSTAELVWALSGNQGTQWKEGMVTLVSLEKFVASNY
ncbi:hypothetical protein DPMN_100947 [Dreissena polymorpha]|uniref:MAM domain-containing protein n=1 Tax=Dreissena polymorpha TaxID=45954 RepID=A0A9D4LID3_DREPO|nr:hypothetical protein DPMN_100947 [Dreissena polymorpha]